MRTAYVCNTPYQLFNLLNLYANNLENSKINTDLFIVNRFRNAEELFKTVIGLNLFNDVFMVIPNDFQNQHLKNKLMKIIYPDTRFRDFEFSSKKFLGVQYHQIFIGDQMPFGVDLCIYNKKGRVIVYEDGLGYYYGDFLHDNAKGIMQRLNKVLRIGRYGLSVDRFYVNNKVMCESTVAKENVQLPAWNDYNPALSIVNRVFEFKDDSKVKSNRFIFLDRPFSENEKYNGLNPESFLIECGLQNTSLIRVHPRSSAKYSLIDTDFGDNMWELECINSITDNHVLIGDFSMAQINPKIIANKEPFLIFVYRLFYDRLTAEENDNFKKQINVARKAYSNKNKIYVPNDITEFKSIIKSIL